MTAASPPGPGAGARRPSRPAGRMETGLSCSAYLAAPSSEERHPRMLRGRCLSGNGCGNTGAENGPETGKGEAPQDLPF
jgi:hypothetical protein